MKTYRRLFRVNGHCPTATTTGAVTSVQCHVYTVDDAHNVAYTRSCPSAHTCFNRCLIYILHTCKHVSYEYCRDIRRLHCKWGDMLNSSSTTMKDIIGFSMCPGHPVSNVQTNQSTSTVSQGCLMLVDGPPQVRGLTLFCTQVLILNKVGQGNALASYNICRSIHNSCH